MWAARWQTDSVAGGASRSWLFDRWFLHLLACAVLEMHPRTFCYYRMVLDMECINRVALDCIETGGSILEESKFYKLNIKISRKTQSKPRTKRVVSCRIKKGGLTLTLWWSLSDSVLCKCGNIFKCPPARWKWILTKLTGDSWVIYAERRFNSETIGLGWMPLPHVRVVGAGMVGV